MVGCLKIVGHWTNSKKLMHTLMRVLSSLSRKLFIYNLLKSTTGLRSGKIRQPGKIWGLQTLARPRTTNEMTTELVKVDTPQSPIPFQHWKCRRFPLIEFRFQFWSSGDMCFNFLVPFCVSFVKPYFTSVSFKVDVCFQIFFFGNMCRKSSTQVKARNQIHKTFF